MKEALIEISKQYGKPIGQVVHDFNRIQDVDVLAATYEIQRNATMQIIDLAAGLEVICTKTEMLNICRSSYFDNIGIEKHGSEYKLSANYKKAPK
jgi:hypothetical protein